MRIRRSAGLAIVATVGSLLTIPLTASPVAAGSSPALIAFDDFSSGLYELPAGPAGSAHPVAAAAIFPQFSPNGMDLAYLVNRGSNPSDLTGNIVVADRDGSHPRTVLTGSAQFDEPKDGVYYGLAWSPNGKDLAYGCDGQQNTANGQRYAQVCILDVDTGQHRQLTQITGAHPLVESGNLTQRMSWTPDGKDIIADVLDPLPCPTGYGANDLCGFPDIGRISASSGSVSLLLQGYAETPALSTNGKEIVYYQQGTGPKPGPSGVAIMDVDGGSSHLVLDSATTGAVQGAIFSPDDKDILYEAYANEDNSHEHAYLIPVSGKGTPVEYTTSDVNVFDAVWAPILTTCTVPDLKHKTLAAAKKLLRRAACSLGKVSGPKSHRSKRHIVKQSPKAKRDEPAGTKVNVRLK